MVLANFWVIALTEGRTFEKLSKIPPRNCALVLGTSPKTMSGRANPYFTRRMEAVSTLYHLGKIRKIIVSGEKSYNYNEPGAMKSYLIFNGGVPEHIIVEDFEGFNTQASVMRCKYIFRENNIIIISQGFHNLRALFLARNEGMDAYAFDAEDVQANESFYRNHSREFLARIKAVAFYIFNVSPKITGEKTQLK
ncbi:vancomycin high temperature exclusion protein [Elizabethkingia sp. JS20170427COW]|uniref:SanA/YdcF family protein n=1 Tax=Elizabethkingia sp. JS20170427COW TaxID=2583851 RepID=UPI00111092F9|nr:ElyC/SanA/YdcF family protein [Elizabethkingia sp. JS20170427COW]QCX52360.1 SanA protein [Elizabethkingia sp. JS20170427COW]